MLRGLRVAAWVVAFGAPSVAWGAGVRATLEDGDACQRATSAGACAPMAVGSQLTHGNEMVASASGATVKLSDGSSLVLGPGATIKLGASLAVPLGGPGGTVKAQYVMLSEGKVWATANPSPKAHVAVLVKGPHLSQTIIAGQGVASVRGEVMGVANLGGRMLATSSNAWGEVALQKARTLAKNEGKPTLRALLGAPGPGPSRQVVTTVSDASESLEAAWQAVPGASGYEVLARRLGETKWRRVAWRGGSLSASLGKQPVGEYEVKVRAVDADGVEGVESAPIAMTVVGVEVPSGAWVSGPGTVQLGEGQQVALAPLEGIEATYDVASEFYAAPSTLGLRAGSGRVLRLRRKGGTVEARLKVEPRTLGAEVEMGPKRASWPRDTISIAVRLVNRAGGDVPSGVKLVPEARLGLSPLQVDWQEDGPMGLKASVPAQTLTSPTVLRVEVKDQHGLYLGRNFLEIDADGAKR